jgi:Fe2+ transport system protein B
MYFTTITKLEDSGVMGYPHIRWSQLEQLFETTLKQVKYFLKKVGKSQVWRCMHLISVVEGQRQGNLSKFDDRVVYIVSSKPAKDPL